MKFYIKNNYIYDNKNNKIFSIENNNKNNKIFYIYNNKNKEEIVYSKKLKLDFITYSYLIKINMNYAESNYDKIYSLSRGISSPKRIMFKLQIPERNAYKIIIIKKLDSKNLNIGIVVYGGTQTLGNIKIINSNNYEIDFLLERSYKKDYFYLFFTILNILKLEENKNLLFEEYFLS